MANADTFEALLDDMQAAALGLISWEAVLRTIARQLGVESAGPHKEFWQGDGWRFRLESDELTFLNYFRHYAGIHPLAARTIAAPAGAVLTDEMIMPGANFGAIELRLARRIAPHLRRAVATYERFDEIRQANAGMMDALDRMRRAVFGLDADGRVVFANQTTRTLLEKGDALRIENGILTGMRADQTRMIHRMLGSVARGDAPASLALERPGGRPPLRLEPVRLGSVNRLNDLQPALRLLLLVHDPEVDTGAVIARLRNRYGLTATEAAVALHASHGKGLASVATALCIGQGTVRSHLKKVFEKTRTNRQAELAWLVSNIDQKAANIDQRD